MPTQPGKPLTQRLAIAAVLMVLAISAGAAGIKAGDTFPDLADFKLEGRLPDGFKGKVVMIDFWASWCEPCKKSFPAMNDLQQRFGPQGVVVLAINVDENKSDMDEFLKKHAATFTVVRDAAQKLVDKAGVPTMPTSFLLDREGKVRFVHSGFRGEETRKKYEQEIETLLKK